MLAFAGLFVCDRSLSQDIQFFDKNGEEVDKLQSYYFITYTAKGSVSYYTQNKKLRYEEEELDKDVWLRTYYYPSGSIRAIGSFAKLKPDSLTKSLYNNGQHQGELVYRSLAPPSIDLQVRILNYWDSLGNKIVDNGNGFCHCDLNPYDEEELIEVGKVVNGQKSGEWTGLGKDFSFSEFYENGILIKGEQTFNGEKFHYEQITVLASPENGMVSFYQHIGSNLIYPRQARRNGVEGQVFIQFKVLADGSISDEKVLKGIGSGCDEEAMRAVRSFPKKWKPGLYRGRRAKMDYTLPIIFKIR